MAHAGDFYRVTLKRTHYDWGMYRTTETRDPIAGEGYIPIPKEYAEHFHLLNSNGTNKMDVLGQNLFYYRTADGFRHGILRAQGCHSAGDIYAKQFSENGDLKAIGAWFAYIGAVEGTRIEVKWESEDSVVISRV